MNAKSPMQLALEEAMASDPRSAGEIISTQHLDAATAVVEAAIHLAPLIPVPCGAGTAYDRLVTAIDRYQEGRDG